MPHRGEHAANPALLRELVEVLNAADERREVLTTTDPLHVGGGSGVRVLPVGVAGALTALPHVVDDHDPRDRLVEVPRTLLAGTALPLAPPDR
ncbi:hypothetical protein [Umezawaea beigongshangensis]|uniref:hypothetical protein n=1 Tax=Umezawaea beigongshangensis TaxID=2780383 RepID=UPI0018F191CD|nr:hypothetical protein [Umezawaea beigongshangensis]